MSRRQDTRGGRSGAPLQYALRQGRQGFSKRHWTSLEGMRAIKQRPYKKGLPGGIPSQGGQRQPCADELTTLMLLKACQLFEATLLKCLLQQRWSEKTYFLSGWGLPRRGGKCLHLMDKGG